MFIAEVAEKMGLFDFLAPRRRKEKPKRESEGSFFKEEGTLSDDDLRGDYQSQSSQLDGLPSDPPEVDPQTYQTQEERQKQSMLQEQRARELMAATRKFFVKNQRVKYYHQANQRWIEEVTVAGVHLDDGPDKPYYTIKYNRINSDGTGEAMEKQTTSDRLDYVEFDAEKSWSILNR